MSRLEHSTKNLFFTLGNSVFSSLLGLLSRTVFIYTLGSEYLGLAGLLGNVLGFLSITELGIATAIGFSLYKPLAEKDNKTISALMTLYRKAYTVIGCVVLVAGALLFLSLDYFVPPQQQPAGTDFAYFAFLLNTVLGYFLSYKTTLISSDNQAYKLVPMNVAANFVQTTGQIIVLLLFKNYVIYLTVQIVCSVVLLIVQNRYITKKYTEVDFYSKEQLKPEQKSQLKRNIGGLVIAKVGDFMVNSTDNLIITKLVSLASTGIYSNYLLIRNIVNGYIATVFASITASFGNIVAVESDEKKKEAFDIMMFSAYYIYSFEAVCFMCLFNPFIGDIWIGKQYLFDTFTVAVIVINNFLTGLRIPLITMKNVSGKYMEDAWIPFAFGIVNLVASVVLAKIFGVAGVFMGTIVGSLLTADWYRPIVIYHHVFHTSVKEYYKNYIKYIVLGVVNMAVAFGLCSLINIPSVLLGFAAKGIVAVAVPLAINTLLFYRTNEFRAVKGMLEKIAKWILTKFIKKQV